MEATVEILRRIGDRVKAGGTYRSEELELDTASYGIQGDPWHVPVKVVSRYAAMPDIKAKLVESHPDLEGKDWSMRYGAYGGGIVASWDGGTGRLSYDEMKALEADHVSDMQVEDVLKRWHVPCDKGGVAAGVRVRARVGHAEIPDGHAEPADGPSHVHGAGGAGVVLGRFGVFRRPDGKAALRVHGGLGRRGGRSRPGRIRTYGLNWVWRYISYGL